MRLLLSEVVESCRIALEQLRAHKSRAFLTALGVVIGVMAVTLMGAAINSIDRGFEQSVEMIGRDVFYIEKWPWRDVGDEWWRYRNRPDITPQLADRLNGYFAADPNSMFTVAVPANMAHREVRRENRSAQGVTLIGTTPEYVLINTATFASGRFFTHAEQIAGANVIILGHDVAESLFPAVDPIGHEVRIRNKIFRVIGVVERQGRFLGMMSWDNMAIMPLNAFREIYSGNRMNGVRVKVREGVDPDVAAEELVGYVRRARGLLPGQDNNFEINRSQMLEEELGPTKRGIAIAGFAITSLALFVGAIGIMNITYVSVKERTREIGTRRALGARRRSILMQFLTEAVSICLIGGVVGLVITWLIDTAIKQAFPDLPAGMSMGLILVAFGISVLTGILSGFAPALAASKLDPATALRHE